MAHFFTLIILLFLSACNTTEVTRDQIIPDNRITSKSIEEVKLEDDFLNVAVLVPLEKSQDLSGRFIIKAAQLALNESANSKINLIPIDSSMIVKDPYLLLDRIAKENIKVILGPVYANETRNLTALLQDKDVTILSLSNDSSIKGDHVLTLGISPDSQASILTEYAISQKIGHFYLLLPSTKYGKLIDDAVQNIVSRKANTSHSVSWYSPENVEQVVDEFVQEIKNDDHVSKAIFMPQAGKNISILNKALEKYNLKIKLIGSQSWDHPSLLHLPRFDGAILLRNTVSSPNLEKSFDSLFHSKPANLDVIAFNAALMIANMSKFGVPIDKHAIIDNNQEFDKYAEIKFTPEGISLYRMPILEIHEKHFKLMDNPK